MTICFLDLLASNSGLLSTATKQQHLQTSHHLHSELICQPRPQARSPLTTTITISDDNEDDDLVEASSSSHDPMNGVLAIASRNHQLQLQQSQQNHQSQENIVHLNEAYLKNIQHQQSQLQASLQAPQQLSPNTSAVLINQIKAAAAQAQHNGQITVHHNGTSFPIIQSIILYSF